MLKTILSVTGKPGLYKLVSSGKNLVIVESLTDKRRIPIHARDKVVSLGDIAMYTDEGEVPLQEVLISIKEKEKGNTASIQPNAKPEELRKYLGEILPSFDKERIYNADIKKLVSWYNLLIVSNIDFEAKQEEESEEIEKAPVEEIKEEPKTSKKAKSDTSKKTATEKVEKADKPEKKTRAKKADKE